jgi:transposase
VLGTSVWREMLGLANVVVESVELDEGRGSLTARVRVRKRMALRCSRCTARAPRYDRGTGRRRWRHLDAGVLTVWIEAELPRVSCRSCGVCVALAPWARAGAGHTYDFDQQVAYLATTMSKAAVSYLMRIAWRTVGSIVARYWQDIDDVFDRFENLTRIGIDEISYKKGHKYLTVVVDHDTGRLLWAAPGHDRDTLAEFFDLLGPERCAEITLVSADAAGWIKAAVRQHCPNAVQCADPFHVIAWAAEALDEERRTAWNNAAGRVKAVPRHQRGNRNGTATGQARSLQHARYALWKNPNNLTENQRRQIDWIAKTDPRLYRAYLLKEALRYVFMVKGVEGREALDKWLAWAWRCRIPAFVKLAEKVKKNREAIDAALHHRLSNALIESTNTKIRVITRVAFGFANPHALIALAMLTLGGYRPTLPGRP